MRRIPPAASIEPLPLLLYLNCVTCVFRYGAALRRLLCTGSISGTRRSADDPANNPSEEIDMEALDLRGLVPAPVTPFTRDGEVDHAAIQRLGSWLGSFKGVKGLVVLGHAGEGTFLTPDEQTGVIESFVKSVDGKIPVIAGITLEGTKVAALEAKRAVKAGAAAGLLYPSHGWLRFGYQKGAPQDRYRAIYEKKR